MTSADTANAQQVEEELIAPAAQAKLAVTIIFLAFMGQMILVPVIPPLARDMGLVEWHLGATISLAALVLAALSPYWGRASQRIGVKRTVTIGLAIATAALSGFGAISYAGTHSMLAGPALVVGVMATRGLFYGAGISAIVPSIQAHLVAHTKCENGRVKALGMIGAANGLASIFGGVLGGALAALGGLMLPLAVMPVLLCASIIVLRLKFHPPMRATALPHPQRVQFTDPRVFPWLVCGLLMFIVLSAVSTIFGFTVQDRFNLSNQATAGTAAIYMTIMGLTMAATQAAIAPKTGWGAAKLMRTGLTIMLAGTILLWPVNSHLALTVACLLLGIGLGLAMPGYSAGPTLKMRDDEQGAVAGLINATNGLAYVIAPITFTALYGMNQIVPFAVSIVLVAAVTLVSFTHPSLKG